MNNISAVRYILASSVILSHVAELMGFQSSFVSHWPIPSYIAVGGFFALSGYLIFGSYERRPVVTDFLRRRARRIMPAYISIVLMCAVGMVFVSSLPLLLFSIEVLRFFEKCPFPMLIDDPLPFSFSLQVLFVPFLPFLPEKNSRSILLI